MRKFQILLAFVCLLIASVLTSQVEDGVFHDIQFISPSFSITTDWFQGSDRLVRLEALKRVLNHIQESYVDPERVKPQAMLKTTLDLLSETVSEVRVLYPSANKAVLLVDKARLELDTNLPTLFALHSSIADALKFVRTHKKSDITDEILEITAVNGVLSTLDPHSVFLSKDIYAETKVGTTGKFGGLGIVIGLRENKLTIISPLEDTPAWRAGLLAEDTILKIGDESTVNMSLTEAVDKMRGDPGTAVTINVTREGWTTGRDFTIVRDIIKIVSVESQLLPNSIGYVKVKNFQGNTAKDLAKHLKKISKEAGGSLKGLILDLRNNPGGLLDQSVAVTDTFLKDGPIVTTVGYSNTVRDEERATGPGTEPNYPMVVLVNPGSASASEIVSGALQRRGRAVVIGQRTFGKGTVQSIFDLPEDTALKLTIAKYLTPGGISIQSIGIVPDVRVVPAYVRSEHLDVFPSAKDSFTEADLEHHFENPKQAQMVPEPSVEVHYLEDRTNKQLSADFSEAQSTKGSILKDFTTRFAADLLRQATSADREELLRLAKKWAQSVQGQEGQKIVKALGKMGITWAEAPKGSDNRCGTPSAAASLLPPGSEPVPAGAKVEFAVTLKNPGPCTLYQAWAQSSSSNYLFANREFLFGKIPPLGEITRKVSIEVPKSTPTNLAEIDLTFNEARGLVPKKLRASVTMKAVEKPQYAFRWDSVKTLPNTDMIEIRVLIKNLGLGTVEEATAAVRSIKASAIGITKGRVPLNKLKPQEEQIVTFTLQPKKALHEPSVDLEFSVADNTYRSYATKNMTLSLRDPTHTVALMDKDSPTVIGHLYAPPVVGVDAQKLAFQSAKTQFVQLGGEISDDETVKDLAIFVNKRKVFYENYEDSKTPKLKQKFDTTVPLEMGLNRILMVTRDGTGLVQREAFIVQREGPPNADASTAAREDLSSDTIDDYLMNPTLH